MVTRKPSRRSASKRAAAPPPTTAAAAGYEPGALGEWLEYLGAELGNANWAPFWPPDAFAIGAALLRRTGGYVDLVNGSGLPVLPADQVIAAGRKWRQDLDELLEASSRGERRRIADACPSQVKAAWTHLKRLATKPISDSRLDAKLIAAAIDLCTVSDEACEGLGVSSSASPFLAVAESLAESNERRSYGLQIPYSKLAVLGKQHTPQRGCSIRSLTHNLALYTPTEIHAIWPAPMTPDQQGFEVFNVLLLPWPTEIEDSAFSTSGAIGAQRYFDYSPPAARPSMTANRVKRAIDRARRHVDRVHAIVLPELAMTLAEYQAVEKIAVSENAFLVSGVLVPPAANPHGWPQNVCMIQPVGLTTVPAEARTLTPEVFDHSRRFQSKHHRWCLDRRQVLQYGLGGRLPASRDCWERSYIDQRVIHFITLTSWLTIGTLICEDLARQEPVTEVVRAVGPNLIFALLMDGPQLKSRWSSRYASVLAEDPGCSVLSLTSLGMLRRSTPSNASTPVDKSPTIALWRDAIYGEEEIKLRDGHDACVLSLVCKTKEEFTIDGRSDRRQAHFPVFAGYASFATPEAAHNAGAVKSR
jgi:hypothetical protein